MAPFAPVGPFATTPVRLALIVALFGLVIPMAVGDDAGPAGAPPPTVLTDVRYGQADGEPLLLDVYRPAGDPGPRPAVLLIHGGGWQVGDKASVRPEGLDLAAAGFVAFAPNYRLKARNPWPAEFQDVQTALRWVQDQADAYGVDPTRIGAFGGSAGGNLAMLLGTNGTGDRARPRLAAVVSWSGPSDLISLSPTNVGGRRLTAPGSVPGANRPAACGTNPNCVGVIDPSVIQAYIGCTVTQCPADYRAASPVFGVNAQTPPMQLAASVDDLVPLPQAQAMADQLTRAGITAEVLAIPGNRHADAYRDVATAPMVRFFQTYLVDGTSPRIAPGVTTTTWLPPSAIGALPKAANLEGHLFEITAVGLAGVALAGLVLVAVARQRRWHPELHRPPPR